MIPLQGNHNSPSVIARVRRNHAALAVFLLFCSTVFHACVRAPRLPVATTDDDITDQPAAEVDERVLTMDDIRSELWHRERTIRFRPSTLHERETVSAIVASLFAGAGAGDAPLPQLAQKARSIGFRLQVWNVAGQRYVALIEADDHRRGAGAYVVRVGAPSPGGTPILLQAPHAYYDLGTDELSLGLFFADNSRMVGLFTNTLHRYWDETGDYQKRERSPADVCHRTDHVFQYATDSAARVIGDLIVLQLHGFADNKRRPAAIVSSGDTGQSSPQVERIAVALRPVLGDVRRFPEETDELGGTTNAQSRLLSTSRRAHFVHLELSSRLRRKLRRSPELLASMARALFEAPLDRPEPAAESQ